MSKAKRERAQRQAKQSHTVHVVDTTVYNRNDSARLARKAHQLHGTPALFLEARDASGRNMRSMPYVPQPPPLIHKYPPS